MACTGLITVIITVGILHTVDLQFMYPVQQPVYMMPPPPPPMPVPVPYPVAVPYRVTQKPTTTTTTEKPEESAERIAIPIAVPMPVPYAVPAAPPPVFCAGRPRAPGCPPCPPCSCKPICTPAFFSYCSPCHQLCRCRYNEAPLPLPPAYPPPPPPGVVVVPFPPPPPRLPPLERDCDRDRRIRVYRSSTEDDSTSTDTEYGYSDSSSSSDGTWFRNGQRVRAHKKAHKKRRRPKSFKRHHRGKNHRRFLSQSDNFNNGDKVKPVLAYVSENGKIVFRKPINDEDAARLMSQGIGGEEQRRQLNNGMNQRLVETKEISGRNKKVLFKTPPHKRVSNLSVSFSLV